MVDRKEWLAGGTSKPDPAVDLVVWDDEDRDWGGDAGQYHHRNHHVSPGQLVARHDVRNKPRP
jgi:hypothetical protein